LSDSRRAASADVERVARLAGGLVARCACSHAHVVAVFGDELERRLLYAELGGDVGGLCAGVGEDVD
jgi:hypothetical protein